MELARPTGRNHLHLAAHDTTCAQVRTPKRRLVSRNGCNARTTPATVGATTSDLASVSGTPRPSGRRKAVDDGRGKPAIRADVRGPRPVRPRHARPADEHRRRDRDLDVE